MRDRNLHIVPEGSNIYTELTAWDNLMFTATLYRVPSEERGWRAQQLLEVSGLWEARNAKLNSLRFQKRNELIWELHFGAIG